ncbi:hypothetical protein ABT336_00290 [Micromonospora sp. NPDC000207]|uniref:hypothetical protein n=1 Tax=Micromonospora sp. NPDC000207 TaxID=3154246 RepID=UPI003322F798
MADLVTPAHLWLPERTGSYGDEAIDLAAMYGRVLDDEQRLAVDAMLSYGPRGRWAAFESAVIEARQCGKTGGIILPVTLFDLFLLPPDKIVWTAHLFRTAREAFNDVVGIIDGCADLSRRVKKISYGNGEEGIYLHSGASLEFLARSKGGGRGIGGKRVVMDEALYLAGEAMGALIPTLAARSVSGDPQIVYGSSAGVLGSDHLRSVRDRGRRGGDPSLVYVEWCAPGSWDDPGCQAGPECAHGLTAEGCALDDEVLWRAANPPLGRRISVVYIRRERRALPPAEFGRERLGWWDDPVSGSVVPLQKWIDCLDATSAPAGRPVFGIDVAPGSRSAAIVAAMWRDDGLPHLEVVAYGPGSDWVPARADVLRKHRPLDWVLDPTGPAGALLPGLAAVGIEPRQMSSRDLGQACEAFAAAVTNETVRHLGDELMTRAIKGAGRREIGDGLWAWSRRKSDVDICPLVGGTEALWALSVVPPATPAPPAPVVADRADGWSETNELAEAGF